MKVIPSKDITRVLRYLLPYRPLAFASLALTLLSSLAALLMPWPLKIIVDNVLERQPLPPALSWVVGSLASSQLHLLLLVVTAGLVIALTINTLHVLSNYVNTKIEQQLTMDFRSDLFQHAQRLSLAFH